MREKWLIASSRRIAHQWLDQVTLAGFPVVNVRVETTRSLALRLLAPALAGGRPALLGAAASRLLVAAAWQRAVRAGGYLAPAAVTPRLLSLAERTLLDLRMAGWRASDLDPRRFVPEAKGRDLKELLQAYEAELVSRGFVDRADTMRLATERLRAQPAGAEPEALLIIPEDLPGAALEREFLEAFGSARTVRLPVDRPAGAAGPAAEDDRALLAWMERPADAPAPLRDGSVRIVRAVGEISEVRGAMRDCLGEGIPLDQVEIVYTAAEPYVPLIYDTALRVFDFDASLDLGVPVTLSEGVPARLARPGRLLRAWLDWIRQDFPQSGLLAMLQAGLLRLPVDEDGDPVGAARLMRALRSLGIGFGRERYVPCAQERLEGLAQLSAEVGRDEDGGAGSGDRAARRLGAMKALAGLIQPLIDATPAGNAPAERAVAAALVLIRDRARTGSALDGLARDRLLQEIQSMDQALTRGAAPPGFDAWEWLAELPDRLRVAGSAPRPGCLHVASIASGGHTGRPCTIIVGLDDSRFPSAGHQDPLVLDVERRQLGGELALSGDRLRRQMDEFARLVCRLRGRVTLSHSVRNLDDDSETFASPVVLSAWRIVSGERRGDHSALKRALPPAVSFAPRSPDECLDGGEWWLWCSSRERPVGNLGDLAARSFPHLERGRAAAGARASDAFTHFDGLVENPGPELDPRLPEGPVLSATGKLKTLGECPLRYFYREVLHIRPPEDVDVDPECWLSHLDYGILMHEVFFDFVGELIAAGHWPPEPARDGPMMLRIVDALAAEWRRKIPPPNAEAYRRQRRELQSAAEIFINEQSGPRHTARPAIPAYLEAAIGTRSGPRRSGIDQADPVPVALSGGATIRCNGRIDRIDRRIESGPAGAAAFLVVDYKSGRSAQRFDPSDDYDHGRLVQHALYLEITQTVLQAHFGPSAAVDKFLFFFPSAALQGRTVEYGRDIIPGGMEVIERLCALAARGAFIATNTEKDCTWCDYRKACQAVNRDLKAYCEQAAGKLANDMNRAVAPFAELRIDR